MIRVRTVIRSTLLFQTGMPRHAHSKPRPSAVKHHGNSNSSKPPLPSRTSLSMPARRRPRGHGHGASALSSSEPSALADFFENYPQFDHDATNSASHEFYRLRDELGWDWDDPERKAAHENFKDALVQQFNRVYGTNEEDLGNWQNLCHITQMDPVPDDLKTCREAVRRTFVNLVDLVDRDVTGQEVQIFETELQLSEYTKNTGKYFPRKNAYAGGLLRYLLRHILRPRAATHRQAPSRGRKKKRH